MFVASAEAGSEITAAAVQATLQVLGAEARIAVRPYEDHPPSDAELAGAARLFDAQVAARLIWRDSERTRATLDVYTIALDRVLHREFEFEPHDRLSERGRAVGLVLAAIVLADLNAGPTPGTRAASPDPAPEDPIPRAPARR